MIGVLLHLLIGIAVAAILLGAKRNRKRALWKTREKPFVPQCVLAGRLSHDILHPPFVFSLPTVLEFACVCNWPPTPTLSKATPLMELPSLASRQLERSELEALMK